MSGINKTGVRTTRNPIQPQPSKTPEEIQRKRGPGTHRTQTDTVGPPERIPLVNSAAQSADSDRASFGTIPIGEGDLPTRTIDRDGLTQDNDELYGALGPA